MNDDRDRLSPKTRERLDKWERTNGKPRRDAWGYRILFASMASIFVGGAILACGSQPVWDFILSALTWVQSL